MKARLEVLSQFPQAHFLTEEEAYNFEEIGVPVKVHWKEEWWFGLASVESCEYELGDTICLDFVLKDCDGC